jgi:serine/threonine-protein kinase
VIVTCMAKRPEERYATARELLAALERPSSPRLGRRRWRRLAWPLAALLGVIALATAGAWRAHRTTTRSVEAGALRGMFDHPPPRSSSPEAARLFLAALRSYHDGRGESARRDLKRAIELDPDLACAHLYLAQLDYNIDMDEGRASFARALDLRASLDEHDRDQLNLLEPVFQRMPADLDELRRRLEQRLARNPDDATALWVYAVFGIYWDLPGSIGPIQRVLAIDPTDVELRLELIQNNGYLGAFDDSLRAAQSCLDSVPGAGDCLLARISLHEHLGDCAAVDSDARRWLMIDPREPRALAFLVDALAAEGRPVEAVRDVMRRRRALLPEGDRRLAEQEEEYALAVRTGDFPAAAERATEWRRLVETSTNEFDHVGAERAVAEVALESGSSDGASRAAREFLSHRDAWEADARGDDWAIEKDASAYFIAVLRRGGVLAASDAEAQRTARVTWWEAHGQRTWHSLIWSTQYADGVETAEEARAAVAVLPRYAPLLPAALEPRMNIDGAVGRTLLLAGRAGEALPHLERAARQCYGLRFPVEHVRASFDLGQAREATGQRDGACAAYRAVLDRWGEARPRSLTAERARERMRTLGCP